MSHSPTYESYDKHTKMKMKDPSTGKLILETDRTVHIRAPDISERQKLADERYIKQMEAIRNLYAEMQKGDDTKQFSIQYSSVQAELVYKF